MVRHLHSAYLVFHQFAIQVGVRTACLWIKLERNLDVRHLLAQCLLVDDFTNVLPLTTNLLEDSMTQGIEGDATVHGTCVDIHIAHLAGQILGHGALAARRMAVNSYRNLFHHFISL